MRKTERRGGKFRKSDWPVSSFTYPSQNRITVLLMDSAYHVLKLLDISVFDLLYLNSLFACRQQKRRPPSVFLIAGCQKPLHWPKPPQWLIILIMLFGSAVRFCRCSLLFSVSASHQVPQHSQESGFRYLHSFLLVSLSVTAIMIGDCFPMPVAA